MILICIFVLINRNQSGSYSNILNEVTSSKPKWATCTPLLIDSKILHKLYSIRLTFRRRCNVFSFIYYLGEIVEISRWCSISLRFFYSSFLTKTSSSRKLSLSHMSWVCIWMIWVVCLSHVHVLWDFNSN